MRNLLAATALIAGAIPAVAADLPGKAAPLRSDPPRVECLWCGFYIGAHGGYGWADMTPDINIGPTFSNPAPKGYAFGGHAGYNWVYGNILAGLEVDYSYADVKDDQRAANGLGLHTKFDALASARARVGFIPNRQMLYGTGVLAFPKSSASVDVRGQTCVTLASANESHFGWVIGGGAEYQIVRNVVLGAEYLYYDFGTTQHNFALAGGAPVVLGVKADSTVGVARGRLSVKF